MKPFFSMQKLPRVNKLWTTVFTILMTMVLMMGIVTPVSAMPIPTTSILSVDPGVSVKLRTNNFPKNMDFFVTIGLFGTLGKGGIEVATTNSGEGGSFDVSYSIPDSLKNEKMLSIRLDTRKGIYAYDFFTNKPDGTTTSTTPSSSSTTTPSWYVGYPTTSIVSVAAGESVSVKTYNFPPNRTFKVRINHFGTLGVNGTEVGTYETGGGESKEVTFNIPDDLKSDAQLAIRFETSDGKHYYAYDWFNNVTGGSTTSTSTTYGTGGPYTYDKNYTGIPLTSIVSVKVDESVTIKTSNFPKNQTFKVLMNKFGTLGVGGTEVGTYESGDGASKEVTFTIPDSLKDNDQIAIRFQTSNGFYYAYDYFSNK
jgi:hypothetical protein